MLNTSEQRTRAEERRAKWNKRRKREGEKRKEKEKTSTRIKCECSFLLTFHHFQSLRDAEGTRGALQRVLGCVS